MDSREDQRNLGFILIVLFISMLFIVWKGRVDLGGAQEQLAVLQQDLANERTFSEEVFVENQRLREASGRLRLYVLDLEANLTVEREKVAACIARMPSLDAAFANMSVPRRRVPLSDVFITPDLVVINLANATHGVVAPTGSMAPLLGEGTIVLERRPESPGEVFIGDIIIYNLDDQRIIHRVVRTGWDDNGWFAVTRGDNNPVEDPAPVRFSQVRGVVVGIIY